MASFFKHVPLVILALTFAAFGISTGEFVMPGLLLEISKDFNISISQSGLLISVYALGVVIGGPLSAIATLKIDKKKALMILMSVFLTGNVLCALSGSYPMLFVARIITALCPGAFFGLATVAATQLVSEKYRTQAVALVFIGTTLANMLGVPFGTILGYFFNWRVIFWIVSLISLAAIFAIWCGLPDDMKIEKQVNIWQELMVFKRLSVKIPLILSALLNGGFFVSFTQIASLLTKVFNIAESHVGLVLFLLGIALPIGTFVGGKLGDKNTVNALTGLFGALMLLSFGVFMVGNHTVSGLILLFLWNTLLFTTTPILQALVIKNAFEAPHLASTFNQSAFNIGNAMAAGIGSYLLYLSMPIDALPLISIAFFGIGFVFVLIYRFLMHFEELA